jgi:hypothetical protein
MNKAKTSKSVVYFSGFLSSEKSSEDGLMNLIHGRVFSTPRTNHQFQPLKKTDGLTFGHILNLKDPQDKPPKKAAKAQSSAHHSRLPGIARTTAWAVKNPLQATTAAWRWFRDWNPNFEVKSKKSPEAQLKEHWDQQLDIINDNKLPLQQRKDAAAALVPTIIAWPAKKGPAQIVNTASLNELVRHNHPSIRQQFVESLAKLGGQGLKTEQAIILSRYIKVFADIQSEKELNLVGRDLYARPFKNPSLRSDVLGVIESLDPEPLPERFNILTPELFQRHRFTRSQLAQAFLNDPVDSIREKALQIMETSVPPPPRKETTLGKLRNKLKRGSNVSSSG